MRDCSTRAGMGLALAALACLALAGCNHAEETKKKAKEPEVPFSYPVLQVITDFEDFTGRLAAPNDVSVRARVTGYLVKVHFKEGVGVNVKEGDPLFDIDPRPYQVKLDAARAELASARANVIRAQALYDRAYTLMRKGAGAQEDVDTRKGDLEVANASVLQADAKVADAQLNLDFCHVTAPISGRISRRLIDPGNLVQADTTVLTTIRSQDPLYAYFDVDEQTVLRLRRLIREGRIKSARDVVVPVAFALADEKGFPHEGHLNFAENTVDPGTGTLRARGVFDNPDGLLSPGLFVRVRVRIGAPHEAMLVAEQALGQDQGERFVYVVKAEQDTAKESKGGVLGVVEYRRVQVGSLHEGLRVIEKGLTRQDKVIVNGLQRVRPGIVVRAFQRPMPATPAAAAGPAAVVTQGAAGGQQPRKPLDKK